MNKKILLIAFAAIISFAMILCVIYFASSHRSTEPAKYSEHGMNVNEIGKWVE